MENKIATSVEQSKKLLELGIIEQRVEKYEKLLEIIKQEMYKMPSIPKALFDSKK